MFTKRERYDAALQDWPKAGTGVHIHMLRIAAFGVAAGLSRNQIKKDIERTMPRGPTPYNEVEVTLDKAFNPTPIPQGRPPMPAGDGDAMFEQIASKCPVDEGYREFLRDHSTVEFWDWPDREVSARFIESLYDPEDYLFLGDTYDKAVDACSNWARRLRTGYTAPHIIPNVFSGAPAVAKNGRTSYRCDAAVSGYRYYMLEFDTRSLEDQFRFFCSFRAPMVALVYSGKKSMHAWVRLDGVTDLEEWYREVVRAYYRRFIPMGVDAACRNPSRLSRLPGHHRKGASRQKLLFLNPKGGLYVD